jgi:biotin transporter BioY
LRQDAPENFFYMDSTTKSIFYGWFWVFATYVLGNIIESSCVELAHTHPKSAIFTRVMFYLEVACAWYYFQPLHFLFPRPVPVAVPADRNVPVREYALQHPERYAPPDNFDRAIAAQMDREGPIIPRDPFHRPRAIPVPPIVHLNNGIRLMRRPPRLSFSSVSSEEGFCECDLDPCVCRRFQSPDPVDLLIPPPLTRQRAVLSGNWVNDPFQPLQPLFAMRREYHGPVHSVPAPVVPAPSEPPPPIRPPFVARIFNHPLNSFFSRKISESFNAPLCEQLALLIFDATRAHSFVDVVSISLRSFHLFRPDESAIATSYRMFCDSDMLPLFKRLVSFSRDQGHQSPEGAFVDVTMQRFSHVLATLLYDNDHALVTHQLFAQIAGLITLGPIFHKLGMKMLPEWFMNLAAASFKTKFELGEYITALVQTIADVGKGIGRAFVTGDMTHLHVAPDPVVKMYLDLEAVISAGEHGEYPREDYLGYMLSIEKSQAELERVIVIETPRVKKHSLYTSLLILRGRVTALVAQLRKDFSSRALRIPSYNIALIGAPGIGKSTTILPWVLDTLYSAIGIPHHTELDFYMPPGREFADGMHPNTTAVILDDPVIDASPNGENPFRMCHDASGPNPLITNQASLENKGRTVDPAMFVILANKPYCGAEKFYDDVLLFARRVNRWQIEYVGDPTIRTQAGVDFKSLDVTANNWSFSKFKKEGGFEIEKLTLIQFLKYIAEDVKQWRITGGEMVHRGTARASATCPVCHVPTIIHGPPCKSAQTSQAFGFQVHSEHQYAILFGSIFVALVCLAPAWVWLSLLILLRVFHEWNFYIFLVPLVPEGLIEPLLRLQLSFAYMYDRYMNPHFSAQQHDAFLAVYERPVERFHRYQIARLVFSGAAVTALLLSSVSMVAILVRMLKTYQSDVPREKPIPKPVLGQPPTPPSVPPGIVGLSALNGGVTPPFPIFPSTPPTLTAFEERVEQHCASFAYAYERQQLPPAMTHVQVHGFNVFGGIWLVNHHSIPPGPFYVTKLVERVAGYGIRKGYLVPTANWVRVGDTDVVALMLPFSGGKNNLHLIPEEIVPNFRGKINLRASRKTTEGEYSYQPTLVNGEFVYAFDGPSGGGKGDCGSVLLDRDAFVIRGLYQSGDFNVPSILGSSAPLMRSMVWASIQTLLTRPDVLPILPVCETEFGWQSHYENVTLGPLSKNSIFRKIPEHVTCEGIVRGTLTPSVTSNPRPVMVRLPLDLGIDASRWRPAEATVQPPNDVVSYPHSWIDAYLTEYASSCVVDFPLQALDLAIESLRDHIVSKVPAGNWREITLEECFRGVPGSGINSLAPGTSAGNLRFQGKKSRYYHPAPNVGDPDYFVLTEQASDAFTCLISMYHHRVLPRNVVTLMPKMNEVVKISKFAKRPARTINNLSMFVNAALRYAFAPLFDRLREFGRAWGSAIGLNCMGSEWTQIAETFEGLELGDGDVAGCDKGPDVQQRWYVVWRLLLQVAVALDYPEHLISFGRWCLAVILTSLINYKGDLVEILGMLMTGEFGTTEQNTIWVKILLRVAFFMHALVNFKDVTKRLYDESVRDLAYGDDTLFGPYMPAGAWFTPTVFSEMMDQCNITITFGEDKLRASPGKRLDEVSFLKRGFVKHSSGKWLCPLDLSSIEKMLSWYEPNKDEAQLGAIVDSAQRELFFHGRTVFTTWSERLRLACQKAGVAFVDHDYNDLEQKWLEGALKAW